MIFSTLFLGFAKFVFASEQYFVALVIGANEGQIPDSEIKFESLEVAEKWAIELHGRLESERNLKKIYLLTQPKREEILSAFDDVREQIFQKKQDNFQTLFLFYYVGHGFDNDLVLHESLLKGEDFKKLIASINANQTIVILDRCRNIKTQGVPEKIDGPLPIPTSSTVTIYSTSKGMQSYIIKDKVLFTSNFLKALQSAPVISMEDIWTFVENQTPVDAKEYGLEQTPEVEPPLGTSLQEDWGRITFNFSDEPSVKLKIGASISGPLELVYSSVYSIKIDKQYGKSITVNVPPGKIELRGSGTIFGTFTALPDERWTTEPERARDGEKRMRAGVMAQNATLQDTTEGLFFGFKPGITIRFGTNYVFTAYHTRLQPKHTITGMLQFDYDHLFGALNIGYGFDKVKMPAWSYQLRTLGTQLQIGPAINLGTVRLSAGFEIGGALLFQKFTPTEESRWSGAFLPGGYLGILYPNNGPIAVRWNMIAGYFWTPGVAFTAPYDWSPWYGFSFDIMFRSL